MRCNLSKMTAAQKKATEDYCKKWIKDEAMPLVTQNVEAIILWQMHEISELGIDLDKICSPFRETEVDVK